MPDEQTTRNRATSYTYSNPSDATTSHPEYAFLPSVVIPLIEPIKLGGATVNELTLRRPKVRDNKAMANFRGTDAERGTTFLAMLTGLAPDEFEQLDGADVQLLGEWLEVFSSARRLT